MTKRRSVVVASVLGLVGLAVACGASSDIDVPSVTDVPDATLIDVAAPGDAVPEVDATMDASIDASVDSSVDASIDAEVDAGPPFVLTTYDINHILGTGQSLSVGARGTPAVTLTQPYDNVMFNKGVIAGGTGLTSFVDLVEGPSVETFESAFANEISSLAGAAKHDLLISGHGIGGQPYSAIKKGGTQAAYANGMAQLAAGHTISAGLAKTYVVRAVTNVHGEADHNANNALYKDNLLEFQSDYETDVKAVTGQQESVPMFITQISSWTRLGSDKVHDIIDGQMLAAHLAAPGKIILVGPKYHYPYFTDGVHLTNVGYDHMGEDYAKAYRRVVLEGKTWEPLRPKTVTRVGKVVTVKFFVPSPPLVIDTQLVSDPGKNGFEFTQTNGNAVEIESVAVSSADTVTITLTDVPTGSDQKVGYAFTGVSGALGGPTTGPRGNLRDSDATPSLHGFSLYNWCIHFQEAVP